MKKLLANENFPLKSVMLLRKLGFDVKAIGEDNKSISDRKVLELAVSEKRLILTFAKYYGELIFHYNLKPPAGVILLRFEKYSSEKPGEMIYKLLRNKIFKTEMRLIVYDGKTIRQRRYG